MTVPTLPFSHAAAIEKLLREAAAPGFYGEIQLTFQGGVLVITRVTRTAKPPHAAPLAVPEVRRGQ